MPDKLPAANSAPRTKHAQLTRPNLGEFNRHELAILGAPCGKIKELTARLLPLLAPTLRVAYVDADHAAGDDAAQGGSGGQDAILQAGATAELTDKITFTRLDVKRGIDKFSQQEWLQHQSIVLVNGNHFQARQQLVILDPAKPVEKKLDRLTDVRALLLPEGVTEVPAYLQAHLAPPTYPCYPSTTPKPWPTLSGASGRRCAAPAGPCASRWPEPAHGRRQGQAGVPRRPGAARIRRRAAGAFLPRRARFLPPRPSK
ncbi:hypothetical protein [Hymenobacter sp. AT01-02]|uniref:hypothetical protein n=1 Tax=Hymenobacter sp. AT01-02 TaxID=1571877 RepID=UPI000A779C01|nr:hypothetical protein [Hymenobacter sp. AT01-02]